MSIAIIYCHYFTLSNTFLQCRYPQKHAITEVVAKTFVYAHLGRETRGAPADLVADHNACIFLPGSARLVRQSDNTDAITTQAPIPSTASTAKAPATPCKP